MSLNDLLSLLLNGLTIGALYGMVGVSLNVTYRPTNIFNFAQGGFVMLGMMVAWELLTNHALPWLPGTLIAVVAVGLLGMLVERVAVAPLQRFGNQSHAWIITTLAVFILMVNISDHVWGSDPYVVPPIPGTTPDTSEIGPLSYSTAQLAVLVIAIGSIAGIEWFYHRTRPGRAVLAVAEDPDGARLCGISPLRVTIGSFAAGAGYAAFVGVAAAPLLLASTSAGLDMMIKGFMALAIGGLASNWGTLLGGMLVASIESLSSAYLSPGQRQAELLLVLLAVMLLRPYGLLGKAAGREV